jgi:SynChlorMet cassette radical SAM/SPASM protein ScmF
MTDKTETRQYPLNQIYFYLTEGCNLRCRHCWIAPKYQGEGNSYSALDLDLFKSIIEQAKPLGLTGVKLTGGEPLLHPHINEILEYIQTEDLSMTLETNGVLCTAELAVKMAACKDPFVSVSLDGADSGTHEWVRGVEGCFDATLQGIRNLVAAGIRPQLIMSIMRHNKDQMDPVVRLAEHLGAGSVKFNIVQPTVRGGKMHDSGETLSIEELVKLGQWVEDSLSVSTNLTLYYDQPLAFRPLGKIGHAATDHLEDIWNNTPVLVELRGGLPQRFEGICGDCLMRELCLGSCIAQNYYRGKSIWAPYWYCEQARNQGLFPETRITPVTL